MKVRLKILLVSTMVCTCCLSSTTCADLTRRVDSIIDHPLQQKVEFSIHIINANSGETVYSHNAKKVLIPASNMKIVVTAAALEYLGPDYEYITRIGLCDDTLVVIGSGDPLLGDEKISYKHNRQAKWLFEEIAAALRKYGMETINDIIIDTTIFDDQRVHPNWPRDDLNRWYACEVSGLNFNNNCIEISAENNAGKIAINIDPPTSYVEFINKVSTTSQGRSAIGAYRNSTPNKITLRGKCKDSVGPFDVAIENPAGFFGFLLAENLKKAGITAKGHIIEKAFDKSCNFRLLVECSTPIVDCLQRCNKDSLGLAAEALLKTIAAERSLVRKNGSWTGGQKAISEYLLQLDLDDSQFYIDDGSGLSHHNRFSAYAITKVIFNVYKSDNWQMYKESLAVGGVDGTISKYFKEHEYKGNIFGKTGYIRGAKSFSGVCSTQECDYIFSILANKDNARTRGAINNIAKAIIDDATSEHQMRQ
jgi:D-alanyl-D-alanine carboxypeptidase/D-alanyl-D-alanine-endopeptidase (penicillin-binding protein 4)